MKKLLLSLLVLFVGLLVWAYASPISPEAVYSVHQFSEENEPSVCSFFDEIYFTYFFNIENNADLILKPLAHLCLWAQLRNIRNMDPSALDIDLEYMKEVYTLDLDNLDRAAYREKHIDLFVEKPYEDNDWPYSMHISSSFTEAEIFNLLLWGIERSRLRLSSEYPDQYLACQSIITEETTSESLSDEQWECLALSHKAFAKYYGKYERADEYSLE